MTKRILDVAISAVGLAGLSPVLALVALVIKLDSQGPVLFSQARIGLRGRTFRMLKFRSMVEGAERTGTGLFSYEDDPRVTRVGRWLRATSVDELPQLFNVFKGEMSIVGPRPPVVYELGSYDEFSDRLKSRFDVKPGITGLAQVSGRNDLDWPEKIELDLRYIERFRSVGTLYDLYLIWLTLLTVLSRRGVIEPVR